jgi:hypothetical protein
MTLFGPDAFFSSRRTSTNCTGEFYISKFSRPNPDVHDFAQGHTRSETTVVITATSVIKIWMKNRPDNQSDESAMPGSQGHGHTSASGVSMMQLLILLILTSILNFALMHFEKVVDPLFRDRLGMIWENWVTSLFVNLK